MQIINMVEGVVFCCLFEGYQKNPNVNCPYYYGMTANIIVFSRIHRTNSFCFQPKKCEFFRKSFKCSN